MVKKIAPSIVFIVFSIILLIETYNFPGPTGDDIGSAVWPRILIFLLLVLSLIYLILTLNSKKREHLKVNGVDIEVNQEVDNKNLIIRVLLGIVTLLLFVGLFETLGYLLSIFLFYIILSTIMFGRKVIKNFVKVLGQAILIVIIIYLVFPTMLNVNLPNGIFY